MYLISICIFLIRSYNVEARLTDTAVLYSNNFTTIASSPLFVDKTLLLEALFCSTFKISVITAPRRFGKTLNLNMVRTFASLEVNDCGGVADARSTSRYELFRNTLVYENRPLFDAHFGAHPVVHLSLKTRDSIKSQKIVINVIKDATHRCYRQHSYLTFSKNLRVDQRRNCLMWGDIIRYGKISHYETLEGVAYLAYYLHQHFNRTVVVLIDDYDYMIMSATQRLTEKSVFESIVWAVNNFIQNLSKLRSRMEFAVITGVSRYAATWLSKDLHSTPYTFLGNHHFTQFYGITALELKKLFERLQTPKFARDSSLVKYGAYVTQTGGTIFCPWSIFNLLNYNKPSNYWIETGHIEAMSVWFNSDSMFMALQDLMKFKDVYIHEPQLILINQINQLRKFFIRQVSQPDVDIPLVHLLDSGYLSYVRQTRPTLSSYKSVSIPNYEITKYFVHELKYKFQYENVTVIHNIMTEAMANIERIKHRPTPSFEFILSYYKRTLKRATR